MTEQITLKDGMNCVGMYTIKYVSNNNEYWLYNKYTPIAIYADDKLTICDINKNNLQIFTNFCEMILRNDNIIHLGGIK